MNKYDAWIKANVLIAYGQCAAHTKLMQAAFPELTRVRGHYHCPIWGERGHWWLTLDGEIVDPPARQFPSKGAGEYVPWAEGAPEPTGRCPNCGGHCYDGHYTCCAKCSLEFMQHLNDASTTVRTVG